MQFDIPSQSRRWNILCQRSAPWWSLARDGYNATYQSNTYYQDFVEAMKGHEAILVMSAGNNAMPISGVPTNIALDDEVGDRVLVVGNYDMRTRDLYRGSNAAGTLCLQPTDDNQCHQQGRISDRYLMAPGLYIASTDSDGSYRTLKRYIHGGSSCCWRGRDCPTNVAPHDRSKFVEAVTRHSQHIRHCQL